MPILHLWITDTSKWMPYPYPIRPDTAIRPDMARYAYREVSGNYDLKIKDLIPDTPFDTSWYFVRYFWANNTSFERAQKAHQLRPIQTLFLLGIKHQHVSFSLVLICRRQVHVVLRPSYSLRLYSDQWLSEVPGRVAPHMDPEISEERNNCFRKFFPIAEDQRKIKQQFADYSIKRDIFSLPDSIEDRAHFDPLQWWGTYGSRTPQLKELAFKLLGAASFFFLLWKELEYLQFYPQLEKKQAHSWTCWGLSVCAQQPAASIKEYWWLYQWPIQNVGHRGRWLWDIWWFWCSSISQSFFEGGYGQQNTSLN